MMMMQLNKAAKLLHLFEVSLSLYSYLFEAFFSPTLCCEKFPKPITTDHTPKEVLLL
jgi:hypothetical protein